MRKIRVIDFFSGCGGSSEGFRRAGMKILAGIDIDANAAATYKNNFPEAKFFLGDIQKLPATRVHSLVGEKREYPLLFSTCAPCQPFSNQNRQKSKKDDRRSLLDEMHRFVRKLKPEYIFLENVPGMQRGKSNGKGPLARFRRLLDGLHYEYGEKIVYAQEYGVPQRRRRLVFVASRAGEIEFPSPTHGPGTEHPSYASVWSHISHLPKLGAGEECDEVPNHRAAKLSMRNLERIKATPTGGDRRFWPNELKLKCHDEYLGHTDVYGRMHKDRPASALTTRCISLSNGRYGHPEQNRAISVREAACLQTFPDEFVFSGTLNSMAQQIGNAVPVLLAEQFGRAILKNCRTRHQNK